MRIIWLLSCASFVSAAITSFNDAIALKTVELSPNIDTTILNNYGYRYNAESREVSEITQDYLPPSLETADESSGDGYLEEPHESTILDNNGYEYKTVRRLKHRQRRQVSEFVNEYLPPTENNVTDVVTEINADEDSQESDVLLGIDVSEIASKYLTPAEDINSKIKSEEEPEESAIFRDNGYEYKCVSCLKSLQRRDVSEISTEAVEEMNSEKQPQVSSVLGEGGLSQISNEYLPAAEDITTEVLNEIKSEEDPQESVVLGESGYEYKTVRRLIHRHRRDMSESGIEYLPPTEDTATEVVAEIKSEEEPQESAVLGESGYEYKTVRQLKHRLRRAVSEIANKHLPPTEESAEEVIYEEEPIVSAVIGDSGYEYKTVRRLKYRQRRDVSELAKEYLPPADENVTEVVTEIKSEEEPQESALLRSSGYEITHKHLSPAEETPKDVVNEIKYEEEPTVSAILGDNGYKYKTVRQLKYRQRRQVSEIANHYLPPAEEATSDVVTEIKVAEDPQDSAVLGDSGYGYKTVRRLKYRHRRDVSEIANDYLPPAEDTTAEVKSEGEPHDSVVFSDNGYEYKTVRRLKYR